MQTPLQELEEKRKEFEQFKKETMQEIQTASIKLDAQLNVFDGYRDINSWKAALQYTVTKADFVRKRKLIDRQIKFKREQLSQSDKIVEKNPGYKSGFRQPFELLSDIEALELQMSVLNVEEQVANKEQEIRDKLRKHDIELMEKHLPEVKK